MSNGLDGSVEDKVTVQTDSGEVKELTRSEYKLAMRHLFTVRNNIVVQCGHKLTAFGEPTQANCDSCWFAFFNAHGEFVQAVDEAYQQHGAKFVESLKGRKFVKNFQKFMSTVAQLRTRSVKETDVESITGTGSSDSAAG